jgi:plastocyanin
MADHFLFVFTLLTLNGEAPKRSRKAQETLSRRGSARLSCSTLFFLLLQISSVGLASFCCGGEITGRVIDAKGAGVAQAIVFVQSPPAGLMPAQAAVAEMDQIHKEFAPSLLPIAVGTEVRFPNRDQIHHHVYSFSRTKNFELPLYKGEDAPPVLFDKPGVVKIGCNIHDWMSAIIFVAPTPYFALSDESGKFILANLPAGDYVLAAWHELSQVKVEDTAQSAHVGEQTPEVAFTLTLAERRAGPTARRGGGY